LEKGEIKEMGTHEALVENGGYYARLIEMQMASVSATNKS
jgi:ABC-type multidrug transport system fused ATPase/permease subunit